ncbi:MAG: hypothetical protein U0169_23825 [Polyangiaceae bacterium]
MAPRALLVPVVTFAAFVAVGCFRMEEIPRNEMTCTKACVRSAHQCDAKACARGCNFSLDRLLEHEGTNVVGCVAREKTCDDRVWATCGATIGAHADGGPPAPLPPRDWDDEPAPSPSKSDDDTSLD